MSLENSDKHDTIRALAELQTSRKQTEKDLTDIKNTIETNRERYVSHFRSLESELAEIRKLAGDALTVSIGVDGTNGLRSVVNSMSTKLSTISADMLMVNEVVAEYKRAKNWILGVGLGSAAVVAFTGGKLWEKNEAMRSDLNHVMALVEQIKDNTDRLPSKPGKPSTSLPEAPRETVVAKTTQP